MNNPLSNPEQLKWLSEIEKVCNAALLDVYDLSIANAPISPQYARETADWYRASRRTDS